MDSLLRSLAIFAFLLIMLRLAGQRTLSEMTSFDFVLLLLLSETAQQARVDEEDIMEAARELQGLERIEQIKYAVLERGGNITIIPDRSRV